MVLTALDDRLQTARCLLSLGFSVVPSGSGPKGKFPLVKWKQFQTRLPTAAELERWQRSLRPRLWGVVTGEISGAVVIDTDDDNARSILENQGLSPHILTPRCANFWFRHPGHFVKTEAAILPSLDVRGDRGFVNVVGTRRDGGVYRISKWPAPENIYPWERLPSLIAEAIAQSEKPQPCPTPIYSQDEDHCTLRATGGGSSLADLLLRRAVASARDGTRNNQGLCGSVASLEIMESPHPRLSLWFFSMPEPYA